MRVFVSCLVFCFVEVGVNTEMGDNLGSAEFEGGGSWHSWLRKKECSRSVGQCRHCCSELKPTLKQDPPNQRACPQPNTPNPPTPRSPTTSPR